MERLTIEATFPLCGCGHRNLDHDFMGGLLGKSLKARCAFCECVVSMEPSVVEVCRACADSDAMKDPRYSHSCGIEVGLVAPPCGDEDCCPSAKGAVPKERVD